MTSLRTPTGKRCEVLARMRKKGVTMPYMAPNVKTGCGCGEASMLSGVTRRMDLIASASAQDWPITPEIRRRCVDVCVAVLQQSPKLRQKLAAVRALAALDGLNVRREANDASERNADRAATAAVLGDAYRAALASQDTRELLIALEEKLAAPTTDPKTDVTSVLPQPEPTHPNHPCGDPDCWCARVTGWSAP
jgi:hypothetical protein